MNSTSTHSTRTRHRRLATLGVVGSLVVSVVLAGCTAEVVDPPTVAATAPSAPTTTEVDPGLTPTVAAILAENADWTTVNDDEWDTASAVDLPATSSSTTITDAGVYRLSGDLGPIVVEAPDDALVVLVLDGASVTNPSGAAIDVVSADDVAIHLVEGTINTVAGAVIDEAASANAAIHADADLTISGTGGLEVVADGIADGIASTDDLVVLGGTITVTAADDALRGKDSLVIEGGSLQLSAGGDALRSDADDDPTAGFVAILGGVVGASAADDGVDATTDLVIAGGTVTVEATGDGLHADSALAIGGGTVEVARSEEGIEAAAITIEGGTTTVAAADDGVNASVGDAGGAASATITGGTLTVDADGDGLDANGSLTMSGGTVVVFGPTDDGNGALDVDGELTISGGDLVAVGSAGMVVAPSGASPQSWVATTLTAAAGSTVSVTDAAGAVIMAITIPKPAASVVVSSPSVVAGGTYSIVVDGAAQATATAGEFSGSGMGGGGMGGGPRP